jgi:hypothetical protein
MQGGANRVERTINGVELIVPRPDGWECYITEFGVILAERIGSVATEGTLGGLLMHIWVQPVEDLNLTVQDDANVAWALLSQIIDHPEYVGDASISEPMAFVWNAHDAAYYLLDNGDGNVSILLGIAISGRNELVTCSLSSPLDQAERIREVLPDLLDGLVINGEALNGAVLDSLPDPLIFPQHDDSEADDAGW